MYGLSHAACRTACIRPLPGLGAQALFDGDSSTLVVDKAARCNYTNPAVAIARTAQSAVVIWRTGVGRFYYKGLQGHT